jgi:arylsulfatase A-like enzyme
LDIHATVLAVAGGEAPTERPLDGVNLLPFVTGANAAAPHDRLFWRFGDQSAARLGNWKLVKQPGTPPQLYNLADDISEKNDLAAKEPDKLAELETAYVAWDKEMIPPKWKQGDRNRRRPGAKPKRKKAAPAKAEAPQPK